MVRHACSTDTAIPCHSTYDNGQDKQAVCRGFFDRYAGYVLPLRLAKAFNKVVDWNEVKSKKLPKRRIF
jgi:hypothetical protein